VAAGLTSTAGKVALASTVGLPVYGPRAATAAWHGAQAGKTAMKGRLSRAQQGVRAGVSARANTAQAFGHEYGHNLAVAARVAGKLTGATHLAGLAADASIAPGVSALIAAGPVSGPPNAADPVRGRPPAQHGAPSPELAPSQGGAPTRPEPATPRPVSPADLTTSTRAVAVPITAEDRQSALRRRLAQPAAKRR
jgi:hypothetical protein